MKTVYFDNSATTFTKPREVGEAVKNAVESCANPSRGSHILSKKADEILYDVRESTAGLFDAEAENVVFTQSTTYALNFAIKGLVERGDHVLIDSFAHNASYRPLAALADDGFCTYTVYNALDPLDDIAAKLRKNTTTIIATHHSNITSDTLPIGEMGRICEKYGLTFIVDAAQSAGHSEISVKNNGINALCVPGHKGLYGPMGVGALVVNPRTSGRIKCATLIEGGAGINSADIKMPEEYPERLEAGTLPLPAICGLGRGIEFVKKTGVMKIAERMSQLSSAAKEGLEDIGGIRVIGKSDAGVVSFIPGEASPAECSRYLSENGICTRSGYHCAPLAHRTFGTEQNGTVRISFSFFNTENEIAYFIRKMRAFIRENNI